MIRAALLLVLAVAAKAPAAAATAATLELPAGATRAARLVEPLGSYRVPTAPWAGGSRETLATEGRVQREAWQVPSTSTTLQLLAPLRAHLRSQGYELLFECETAGCGGFDFRFETDVLPDPDMHVDLSDFRFLAARRMAGGAPEYVTLLVSRTTGTGYIQVVRVGPEAEIAAPESGAPPDSLAEPAPGAEPPPPPPDALAAALERTGRTVLTDLSFEIGSSRLAAGPIASLAALADYLRANPGRKITLVGHTDAAGGLDANLALSRARARSARARLIEAYGIPASQIEAEGVGYLMPLASNLTEEGRALNRRVEAVLSSVE